MKKKCVLFVVISLFSFSFVFASSFDAKKQAKETYSQVKPKVGTSENLTKHFISPLLGNGTLSNIEGKKSFQSTLVCPSTRSFLEITMQPSTTGDVSFIVYYDTNFDGRLDKSQSFSGISGLCSNGFIRCNPGTWQNCKYYKVRYDGTSLIEEVISALQRSSCFCLNNSCGSNLAWKNANYVLSTFGGVIVSAFQAYNQRYAVSKSDVQNAIIRYYGQDVGRCQYSPSVKSGLQNPAIFYGSPGQLKTQAQQEFTKSEFTSLFTNISQKTSERVCTARRIISTQKVSWTDLIASSASQNCNLAYNPELCGEDCVKMQLPIYIQAGGAYSTSVTLVFPRTLFSLLRRAKIGWCTDTTGPFPCTDDDGWYNFSVNGELFASGGYGDCEPCWHEVQIPLNKLHEGENVISVTIGGAGGGYGVQRGCRLINLNLFFERLVSCFIEKNTIEDNCVSLRKNPDCYLKDRIVDGVYVVKNGQKTGLVPLLTCQEFCGELFCYNDWSVEEHYLCKTEAPSFDFTRSQKILSTLKYDANLLTFDDIRSKKGTWHFYPHQQMHITLEKEEACPKVCKVKVTESLPEVGSAGPLTYTNVQLPKVFYDFRNCEDNKCPYDPAKGEELVNDCACLSDFYNALITLQAVRLAGQDIICSTGNEKTVIGW